MINFYIKKKLDDAKVRDLNSFINVIREETQKIILFSLSKTDFFKKVSFYGGTCLRVFHDLGRFSEDLDFEISGDNIEFNFSDYENQILIDLNSYGFKTSIHSKPNYDVGEIKRRYVNIAIYDLVKEYLNIDVNKEQNVSIKLEVSNEYVGEFKTENALLKSPLFATIKCYDLSTLFAGKLGALIFRNWKTRVKGRDFYDYMFYISNDVKFNIRYFNKKYELSSKEAVKPLTLDDIKKLLIERFNSVDFDSIKQDLKAFVGDETMIQGYTKDLFLASLKYLECE